MTFVDYIEMVLLVSLSLGVLYLYFLAAVGIFGKRRLSSPSRDCAIRILVPAYNEEAGIADTLASLQKLEPAGWVEIVVIADNCTDRTAEIARAYGVRVLERADPDHRGKGEALEWAIDQCGLDDCDVVLVTDADTEVESNALRVIAAAVESGAGVVQLNLEVSAGCGAPLARLQNIANAVENRYFYHGRSLLHLPVLLRGSGMAFTSGVLRNYPFRSHSITEDSDFAVDLMRGGVRVDYVMESTISTAATSTYYQSQAQRDRWASGIFSIIKSRTMPLLRTGLATGRFGLVESASSLFLLSRLTMIYLAAICMMLSLGCSVGHRIPFLIWSDLLCILIVLYLISGILLVKEKKAALESLLYAPAFGIWLFAVQARALFGRKDHKWVRTERESRTGVLKD